jgi:peptidoglycan/xylan/chitin deacetylase (PgdA/CDA1 family)
MFYAGLAVYASAGACLLGFLYFGIPWMYGRWLRVLLSNRAAKDKTLVLTFDDGPGSRLTPAILDILKAHNAKATFFLLGRNIAGREHLVKRIDEEGHEICSHGYGHINYWKVLPNRALSDIEEGRQAINKAIERDDCAYPFRPPYGKLNLIALLYLWIHRASICYWTVVSGDTWPPQRRDSRRIAEFVGIAGGAVLLVHDFDRTVEGDDTVEDYVLDTVKAVLEMAERKGMAVKPFRELMSEQA